MPPEVIALISAFSYSSVSISARLGLKHSTPLTATCVALGARTVIGTFSVVAGTIAIIVVG